MKYEDDSWDFRKSNTKELTHCLHAYPAMMIPQIARRLLQKYGESANRLLDPYCGTGTSLLEANMAGIDAIGTDLNPLARLIAHVKTTPIGIKNLDRTYCDFQKYCHDLQSGAKRIQSVAVPEFSNLNYWFTPVAIQSLSLIKEFISSIKHRNTRDFFLVAFSETVRSSSLTKKGEFKLVRIPKEKQETFQPDCFGIMLSKLSRNIKGMRDFIEQKKNDSAAKIYDFNTVDGIPERIASENTIDIVITSPPYGDSQTTVAYGQYSRLANQWMGVEDASSVDKRLMGGVKRSDDIDFESETLKDTLKEITNKDSKRSDEVRSFFVDYKRSIDNLARVIRPGGTACYVVGNRRVKDTIIPTDEITKDFFVANDFTHLETIIRSIPNKRMPSINSPSNVPGQNASTMKNEYIVCVKRN